MLSWRTLSNQLTRKRGPQRQPIGNYSARVFQRQQFECGGTCYYCGRNSASFHRDHRVPLVKNGANEMCNIVPACPDCNLRKGKLTDAQFFRRLEFMKLLRLHVGPREWCRDCETPVLGSVTLVPNCRCSSTQRSKVSDRCN